MDKSEKNVPTVLTRIREVTITRVTTEIPARILIVFSGGEVEVETLPSDTPNTIKFIAPESCFSSLDDELVFIDPVTKEVFGHLIVGPNRAVGWIDGIRDGKLVGWFSCMAPMRVGEPFALQLYQNNRKLIATAERVYRKDLAAFSLTGGYDGFSFTLPKSAFDGTQSVYTVRFGDLDIPRPLIFRPRWDGCITSFDGRRVRGWIEDRASLPGMSKYRIMLRNRTLVRFETGLSTVESGRRANTFDVTLPEPRDGRFEPLRVVAEFDVDGCIFGPEAFLTDHQQISILRALGTPSSRVENLSEAEVIWTRAALAPILKSFRSESDRSYKLRRPRSHFIASEKRYKETTIIVPVYEGLMETEQCLASLAAALSEERNYSVLVINDCSPNRELTERLPNICREYGFHLLKNSDNLGFVKTINLGVRLRPRDDILILNSDTVLAPGFLTRMRRHLYSSRDVASVTPFSNDATILSYPLMNASNAIGKVEDIAELSSDFAACNDGRSISIPTGIGFCMIMSREVIDVIGAFDEELWDTGYCEENDWSLRASDVGFKHLAACDVFVGHRSGVSFGASKESRLARNIGKLLQLYPEYQSSVDSFIAEDPAAPFRRAVDLARLARDDRPKILLITVGVGGGIDQHVEDLARSIRAAGALPLILSADHSVGSWVRTQIRFDSDKSIIVRAAEAHDVIVSQLGPMLKAAHVHTLVGVPLDILDVWQQLRCRKFVSLHDYSAICPRVTLLSYQNKFCGVPTIDVCERCVGELGAHSTLPVYDESFERVADWRSYTSALLDAASIVMAPSQDAAVRLSKSLNKEIDFAPNIDRAILTELRSPKTNQGSVEVILIGAIGSHKGHDRLLELARDINNRQLPIRINVVGFTANDSAFSDFGFVSMTGAYSQVNLHKTLEYTPGHLALFLSPWPETYSFTLSEAWRAGLPVLVPNLGALQERVRMHGGGWIYDTTISAATLNDTIIAIGRGELVLKQTELSIHENEGSLFLNLYEADLAVPTRPSG